MSLTESEIEEFRIEALELLESAEKSLLEIGDTSDYKKVFDTVFRCFHNLKGGASVMELEELQAHTHKLEDILMSFKEQAAIPMNCVSLFFAVSTVLVSYLMARRLNLITRS